LNRGANQREVWRKQPARSIKHLAIRRPGLLLLQKGPIVEQTVRHEWYDDFRMARSGQSLLCDQRSWLRGRVFGIDIGRPAPHAAQRDSCRRTTTGKNRNVAAGERVSTLVGPGTLC
jgi:hypothetical protein